ncbi:tandem-95 repeat protein [Gilvimarinus sp. SDUM040013]|uniref:Tandem-95 repeat protein n=1 Tax=Gilvimarinus gilvus TaxID=3058038 RepID=A0ABU4RWY5_9GAMM|nr:tandem-95 repeat protein [Gilvimarinus sp. SDUM040013]MDX6848193.1 tandem-95 repeat protein [Gilvimarinus sp. SDUM040013]
MNAETFAFSIAGSGTNPATSGTDFNGTLTFSAGVTDNGNGTITVDAGVSSFTVTVASTEDSDVENDETYTLTVDGEAATGTITDDDTVPEFLSGSDVSGSAPNVDSYDFASLPEGSTAGTTVGTVVAEDLDGGTLSYRFSNGTQTDGVFTINASSGEITLNQDIDDPDLGEFNLNVVVSDDGFVTIGDTASVAINLVNSNDDPDAVDDDLTTAEDTPITLTAADIVETNDTDLDGDNLVIIGVSNPVNGTVVLNNGIVTFTPTENFVGDATFEYTISDNNGGTDSATVTIAVTPVNDAPTTTNGSVETDEDVPYVFSLSDFSFDDVDDGDSIASVTIETVPGEGVLQFFDGSNWAAVSAGQVVSQSDIADDNLRYEPLADAPTGADSGTGNGSFTYSVSDGSESSNIATMTVSVNAVADDPNLTLADAGIDVSNEANFDLPTGNGLVLDRFNNVPTVDTTIAADADVLESALSGLTPDSTQVVSELGDGTTSGDSENIPLDGAVRLTGLIYLEPGDYEVEGYQDDTLHIEIGGNILWSAGYNTWGSYTSDTLTVTESGYYTFELYAYNGANSEEGWVSALIATDGGSAQTLDNYSLFTDIQAVTDAGGQYSTYSDNGGDGGYYPVRLNEGLEDTPIQLQDISASLNDLDGSESLAVVISQIPAGSVLSDGSNDFTATSGATSVDVTGWDLTSLTITAPSGYFGSFDLTVSAIATESSNGDQATVDEDFTVVVLPAPDVLVPDAEDDTYTVAEDDVLTGNVSTNDTQSVDAPNVYTVEAGDGPANGVVTMNTDGTFTYTPNSDFNGSDSFIYTVTDSNGDSDTATAGITVTPTSPAIDAVDDSVIINGGSSFTGSVAGNDLLGETPSNFTIATNVSSGTLVLNNDGSYTYTPTTNFSGSDSFTYTIVDADGQNDTATVNITVVELNDNAGTVFEEALPSGSNSASNAEVTSGNLLSDDQSLPSNLSLAVSIPAGSVDNSVAGQSTITTAEGNVLVVNTDNTSAGFGDYTYTLVNQLNHLLAENDFASGTDGWTGSGVSNNTGSLQIDRDSIATQTFNFDDTLGGQQVTLSFTLNVSGGWDTSGGSQDYFSVSDNSGVIYSASPADGSTSIVSVPVTLDANGDVTLQLNVNTTADAEVATIDDLTIMAPQLTDTFTYTLTDGTGYSGSANLNVAVVDDLGDTPRDYDESIEINENQDIGVGLFNLLDNASPESGATVSSVNGISIVSGGQNITNQFVIIENATASEPGNYQLAHIDGYRVGDLIVNSDGSVSFTNTSEHVFDFLAAGESATINIDYTVAVNGTDLDESSNAQIEISGVNDAPVAVDDSGLVEGAFSSQFWIYEEGAGNPNLETIAQVFNYANNNTPDAVFTTTELNYGEAGGDLGANGNLASWIGDDADSLVWQTASGTQERTAEDSIVRFNGVFNVTTSGVHTFNVTHDDGFIILVDGEAVMLADFITPPSERSATVTLSAGTHNVEIYYWDQGGQYVFDAELDDPSGNNIWVPGNIAYTAGGIEATQNTDVTVNVLANDWDIDGSNTLSVQSVGTPGNGSAVDNGNGTITYTPAENFVGLDSFQYTIVDSNGATSSATVTIDVQALDVLPVLDLDGNDSTATGNDFETSVLPGESTAVADTDLLLSNESELQGAIFTLTNPADGDSLSIDASVLVGTNITVTEFAADGTFVLSGNASVADYQAAISQVVYNAGDGTDSSDRVIEITVEDASGTSNTASATVNYSSAPAAAPASAFAASTDNVVEGTSGDDVLEATAATDTLSGLAGADTFAWSLGDEGTAGTPASDTVSDFNLSEGDVLALGDLLQGENSGNLTEYLHFETTTDATIVHISSTGSFDGSNYTSATDQTITLEGVSLSGSDTEIINQLLTGNHLDVE